MKLKKIEWGDDSAERDRDLLSYFVSTESYDRLSKKTKFLVTGRKGSGKSALRKKLEADFNPKSEFAAIMTCSQADGGCPFIAGAEKRIPITFEDPKAFDNTPLQAEKYKERSLQIATEMFYVFSQIQS